MALHIAFNLIVHVACSGSILAAGTADHINVRQRMEPAWPMWGMPGLVRPPGVGGFHPIPYSGGISGGAYASKIPYKTHKSISTQPNSLESPPQQQSEQHLRIGQPKITAEIRAELDKDQQQVKADAVLLSQLEQERDEIKHSSEKLIEDKKRLQAENDNLKIQVEAGKMSNEKLLKSRQQMEATSNKLAEMKKSLESKNHEFAVMDEEAKKIAQMVAFKNTEKNSMISQSNKLSSENDQLQTDIDKKETDLNDHIMQLAEEKKQLVHDFTEIYRNNQELIQSNVQRQEMGKKILEERQMSEKTRSELSTENQQLRNTNAKLTKTHATLTKQNHHLKTVYENAQSIVQALAG